MDAVSSMSSSPRRPSATTSKNRSKLAGWIHGQDAAGTLLLTRSRWFGFRELLRRAARGLQLPFLPPKIHAQIGPPRRSPRTHAANAPLERLPADLLGPRFRRRVLESVSRAPLPCRCPFANQATEPKLTRSAYVPAAGPHRGLYKRPSRSRLNDMSKASARLRSVASVVR